MEVPGGTGSGGPCQTPRSMAQARAEGTETSMGVAEGRLREGRRAGPGRWRAGERPPLRPPREFALEYLLSRF